MVQDCLRNAFYFGTTVYRWFRNPAPVGCSKYPIVDHGWKYMSGGCSPDFFHPYQQYVLQKPPKKIIRQSAQVAGPSVWSLGLLNQSWRRSRSSLLAFCQHHQHPQSYVSPLSRVIPLPNGLNDSYMGLTNHLLTGMILQVLAFCQNHWPPKWGFVLKVRHSAYHQVTFQKIGLFFLGIHIIANNIIPM